MNGKENINFIYSVQIIVSQSTQHYIGFTYIHTHTQREREREGERERATHTHTQREREEFIKGTNKKTLRDDFPNN